MNTPMKKPKRSIKVTSFATLVRALQDQEWNVERNGHTCKAMSPETGHTPVSFSLRGDSTSLKNTIAHLRHRGFVYRDADAKEPPNREPLKVIPGGPMTVPAHGDDPMRPATYEHPRDAELVNVDPEQELLEEEEEEAPVAKSDTKSHMVLVRPAALTTDTTLDPLYEELKRQRIAVFGFTEDLRKAEADLEQARALLHEAATSVANARALRDRAASELAETMTRFNRTVAGNG